MATLAEGGRSQSATWTAKSSGCGTAGAELAPQSGLLEQRLAAEELAAIDLFDRLQLDAVLCVCRASTSLSDAGRRLFAVSRTAKSQPNDADRLRKFLARFGLSWKDVATQREL